MILPWWTKYSRDGLGMPEYHVIYEPEDSVVGRIAQSLDISGNQDTLKGLIHYFCSTPLVAKTAWKLLSIMNGGYISSAAVAILVAYDAKFAKFFSGAITYVLNMGITTFINLLGNAR